MRYFLASIIIFIGTVMNASADTSSARQITIVGVGEVSATPDVAHISVGVQTDAKTAAEALEKNTKLMRKVFETIKTLNIPEQDIKTTQFAISPRWDRRNNQTPTIAGYSASNSVLLKLRKMDSLGQVYDMLVKSGANQMGNINFGIEDTNDLLDEARIKAVKDAKRKAKLYAEAAGVTLGLIRHISEPSSSNNRNAGMMMRASHAEAAPIATGSQSISAQITIVWELY